MTSIARLLCRVLSVLANVVIAHRTSVRNMRYWVELSRRASDPHDMILPVLLAAEAIVLVIALPAAWALARAASDGDNTTEAMTAHRLQSDEDNHRLRPAAITVAVLVPAVDNRGAARLAGAVTGDDQA